MQDRTLSRGRRLGRRDHSLSILRSSVSSPFLAIAMKAMRFIFIFALCTTSLPLASCGHTSDVSDPALATRRTHESKNHIGSLQANSQTFDLVPHEENTERFADSVVTSVSKLVDGLRRISARRWRTKIKTFDGAIAPSAVIETIGDARVAPVAAVDHINSPSALSRIEELTIQVGLGDNLEQIVFHPDGRTQVPDGLDDMIKQKHDILSQVFLCMAFPIRLLISTSRYTSTYYLSWAQISLQSC